MEFNTLEFRTRSYYIPRENLHNCHAWPLATDIGYSGVKLMSPNCVCSFPSYASREDEVDFVGRARLDDILYRDENDVVWRVGNCALEALKDDDSNDSGELFNRYRYYNPMFLVLARVAMARGMSDNKVKRRDNRELFIQTGLPSDYLKADTPAVKEVFAGRHCFAVKIGTGKWREFDFTIPLENIDVMDQAMGAVFSAAKLDNGESVAESSGRSLVEDRLLVCDGGFKTFNVNSIAGRKVVGAKSYDDLGMEQVLKLLVDKLESFGVVRKVHTIQPLLEVGHVYAFDRGSRTSRRIELADMLKECSEEVAAVALERLETTHNYLQGYQHLVLSGGTCAAWLPLFKTYFTDMEWLNIISSNRNHDLDSIFSNVRGYYLYREAALRHMEQQRRKKGNQRPGA